MSTDAIPFERARPAHERGERACDPAAAPRAIRADERQRLVAWLDDGLREGQRGALEAEYPLSMGRAGSAVHRVVYAGERPLAHAMLHPMTLVARGRELAVGLIGNVYTEPERRGRGLASACIDACVDEARRRGLSLVLLWSDLLEFYAKLGFHACGRETYLAIDGRLAAAALADAALADRALADARASESLDPSDPTEFAQLERLYRDRETRALRSTGAFEALASGPGTRIVVDRGQNGIRAYAALGRGPDFPGVVHEWAGDTAGVLACLAKLCASEGPLLMLAGPEPDPLVSQLCALGAPTQSVHFALAKLLDAQALWQSISRPAGRIAFRSHDSQVVLSCDGSEVARLSEAATLRWLFDGRGPAALPSHLRELVATELVGEMPWPLYLWGFDSI